MEGDLEKGERDAGDGRPIDNTLTEDAVEQVISDESNEVKEVSSGSSKGEEKSPPRIKHNHPGHVGWKHLVCNFIPSWFTVSMGTGIVSILLNRLPYNGSWLYYLSIIFFCLNVLLFSIFTFISILRYTLFPAIWPVMIRHPSQSLFIGTFPVAFATIVNMFVFVCVPAWGEWAITFAWCMWWIDVVVAVAICFWLPFVIMYMHSQTLSTMTALWLLPTVSTIVAASSGALLADILPNPSHALITLLTSYILWGTGVPLALSTLVIYFQRLTVYHLPPSEVIVSVFLPLGLLGQAPYGIMQLGHVALRVFPETKTLHPLAGPVFYIAGFMAGLILWGFGLVWFFFALASISRSKFPFNMGWWGFTFPLGVYAAATVTIGKELPSKFFSVLGTVLSVAVVILWCVVAVGTIQKSLNGEFFLAPCLTQLPEEVRADMKGKLRRKKKGGKEKV